MYFWCTAATTTRHSLYTHIYTHIFHWHPINKRVKSPTSSFCSSLRPSPTSLIEEETAPWGCSLILTPLSVWDMTSWGKSRGTRTSSTSCMTSGTIASKWSVCDTVCVVHVPEATLKYWSSISTEWSLILWKLSPRWVLDAAVVACGCSFYLSALFSILWRWPKFQRGFLKLDLEFTFIVYNVEYTHITVTDIRGAFLRGVAKQCLHPRYAVDPS